MDVINAYLYGNLDIDICMKVTTRLVDFHNPQGGTTTP